MKGSTWQNSEVLAGLFVKCLRLKELWDRKKKCLGKAVLEKFMAYIGWLDQVHKISQNTRNTKIFFPLFPTFVLLYGISYFATFQTRILFYQLF